MSEDTITTVGRHLAHWRPSADADAERARIVAWLRADAASRASPGAPSRVLIEWYCDAIENREHEKETAGGT